MCGKLKRTALPVRGSGISPKIVINDAIGPAKEINGRIKFIRINQTQFSNAIHLGQILTVLDSDQGTVCIVE